MTTPTPRRPRRSLAQQEQEARELLASIEAKKETDRRKKLAQLFEDMDAIPTEGLPFDGSFAVLYEEIANWLSSAKPGEGK